MSLSGFLLYTKYAVHKYSELTDASFPEFIIPILSL